ncbi:mandelamide amidase [Prauserella halophila]|nr:mandelamide amidase [Prauserella halophila]
MIDDGALDAEEYRQALHDRGEQVQDYNALTTLLADPIKQTGQDGLLAGVPVVVKDSIDVAGVASTAGTPALADNIASRHAPLVQRLVEAGAVVAGKTVMHELSLGGTSHSGLHGVPKNPWAPQRISGGSSGGSAAAVALGIAPISIGADTGGSVRVPAALCGVLGFRPSVGRYPEGGTVPLAPTRDTAGPIARSMEDILAVDAVLSGRSAHEPGRSTSPVTLGISPSHRHDLDSDVSAVLAATLHRLGEREVRIVTVDVDDLIDRAHDIAFALVWGEAEEALQRYFDEHGGISLAAVLDQVCLPDVASALRTGLGSATSARYQAALLARHALQEEFVSRLRDAGAAGLIFPTTPVVAPGLDEEHTIQLNGRPVPTFATLIRHGDFGGTLGLPGISLPAGRGPDSCLPVGIELTCPPGDDDRLLVLAAQLAPQILDTTSPNHLVPVPNRLFAS